MAAAYSLAGVVMLGLPVMAQTGSGRPTAAIPYSGSEALASPSARTAEVNKGIHPGLRRKLGLERALPVHLEDDDEFRVSIRELIRHGKRLFDANWTEQDGGGRPLMKGIPIPLSDLSSPLTGARAFNRVSGPDANSCAGCHNAPYGHSGGGGDFVTSVFVTGQRFDFVSFDPADETPTRGSRDERGRPVSLHTVGNVRATTGMFGAGYLEMLARQMTAELQGIRDTLKPGMSAELWAKGVYFGRLARGSDSMWDTSRVEGLGRLSLVSSTPLDPPSLVIRPWHQSGNVVSLREFSNNAFHQHHGIQSSERFGIDTDPDGDGISNELTRADITAVALYQATLPVPGRVIPNDPVVERAVLRGEAVFGALGCAACHVPSLPLDNEGWVYSEPNPYNPPSNLRTGQARASIRVDLNSTDLPLPRLAVEPTQRRITAVPAYTDFKLHNMCEAGDTTLREPVDDRQTFWTSPFHEGNCRFLTKRLWGAANEPPYFHHGLITTLRGAILAHAGEGSGARDAFIAASEDDQDALIEFLKTLQVLPPGTRNLIVDEEFRPKPWPPSGAVLPQETAQR